LLPSRQEKPSNIRKQKLKEKYENKEGMRNENNRWRKDLSTQYLLWV
jgi:hypothetical protein